MLKLILAAWKDKFF